MIAGKEDVHLWLTIGRWTSFIHIHPYTLLGSRAWVKRGWCTIKLGQWFALRGGQNSGENINLARDYSMYKLRVGVKPSICVVLCKD